jgi:hypothetical protein
MLIVSIDELAYPYRSQKMLSRTYHERIGIAFSGKIPQDNLVLVVLHKDHDMDFKDLKSHLLLLLLLLGVVGIFYLLTLLFPVYLMPDGSSARHAVWNPPMKKMDRSYERLTSEEISSMQANERGKALLEAMKNAPAEKAYPHSYVGSIGESDFNILGWLTMFAFIGWLGFTGFRGYQLVMTYLDMKRLAEEKKKKALPFDVRRVSDKRR